MSHELIDKCIDYIVAKDAVYLAKEGQVVYFDSSTGQASDFVWHKQSMNETLRIIRAIHLNAELASQLKEQHLMAAFQELGKVYEYAVKSQHKAREGVFNYREHAKIDLSDDIASSLIDELERLGYRGMYFAEVLRLATDTMKRLNCYTKLSEARELLIKHFEAAGYVVKLGSKRPLIRGFKHPAVMAIGAKPRDIVSIPPLVMEDTELRIYKELR